LHRRKIVKKITKVQKRFQADRFKRLNVGDPSLDLIPFYFYSQILTDKSMVSIAPPEEDLEESSKSQRLVTSKIIKLDISWLTDSRKCSSATNLISSSFS